MQGPRGDEAIQGLDGYEQMVDNFAEQAKAYWRLWGPLGSLNASWCRRFIEGLLGKHCVTYFLIRGRERKGGGSGRPTAFLVAERL